MVFKILRPDSHSVWKNEKMVERFSYYRGILDGKKLARFLIAKSVECTFNKNDSIENLKRLLKEKSSEFKELLKNDFENLKNRELQKNSYIDLVELIANKYLENLYILNFVV